MGNGVALFLKAVRSLRFLVAGLLLVLYCVFALATTSCSSTAGNYNWAWWVLGAGAAYWLATEYTSSSTSDLTVENQTTLTLSIYVDGTFVGTVGPDASRTFNVDIGTHTLRAESGDYVSTRSYTATSGYIFTWTLYIA